MSQLVRLVDGDVEDRAIVINTPPTEDRRSVVVVERIRETEPWLERAIERLPIVSRADVATQVERDRQLTVVAREGVHHHFGRYVVVIHHLRLVIPPDADVQREPLDGTPVVLRVNTHLG